MQKELVVFCAVLGVCFAAVGLAKLEEKPEKYKNAEGCYIGEMDVLIPFGEARPSTTSCMEYRCGQEWVQYVSCGAVAVSPPHELVVHAERPYPGCCPTIKEDTVATNSTVETTKKL